jgi:hypothetical protein
MDEEIDPSTGSFDFAQRLLRMSGGKLEAADG